MNFLKIASIINELYGYDLYLTFFHTFKGCILSESNVINFCNTFNLDINNFKQI
jgi:hypothetical protein